jgi:cell pole-organizing protein PopZ
MDDILASIRKILNEDEQGAATIVPGPAAPPAPIQLTPEMMITPPESLAGPATAVVPAPAAAAVSARAAPVMATPAPEPVPMPPPAPEPLLGAPPALKSEPFLMSLEPQNPPSGLVDPVAAAAAATAFGQLSRLAQDRGATVARHGPSIEDLVREELRPMLKAWLDAHLPVTVERLVRVEIERVMSRQG